jgi:molybdate transport system substrate-binding protein
MRPYPNGAAAMRALARSAGATPIGCTQITEIKHTQGVTLAGPLPSEFELATVYSVAVSADTQQPDMARRFARLLCGSEAKSVRAEAGFEVN